MNFSITYTDSKHEYYSDYYRPHLTVFSFEFYFDNIVKILNINSLRAMTFDDIWNMFRRKYCPTRILQYGTISRDYVGDDRTLFEKACDVVSEYFFKRRQDIRNGRAVWNGFSFFDWTTSKQVTNMTQIHEIEKQTGKQMVSWRDKEVEESKIQRQMVIDEKEKIKKKIHHVFSEVQKGRSYTKEIRADREAMRRQFS